MCIFLSKAMDWFKIMIYDPKIIAAILAAIIAPWTAVKIYLSQQRIARVQKIYYEESLLDQLRYLDDALDITVQNFALFDNVINFIIRASIAPTAHDLIINSVNEIANKIVIPPRYQSSKREVLITLFKRKGYPIYQWLLKFDSDFVELNSLVREEMFSLILFMQQSQEISPDGARFQDNVAIANSKLRQIAVLQPLLARHQVLIHLLNTIIARISTMDFKSLEALSTYVTGDKEILSSLEKMDEVFKILFGYYVISKNVYLSYLTDEYGQKYRLTFGNTADRVVIDRIAAPEQIDQSTLIIVQKDAMLAALEVIINGEVKRYSRVQIGMANLTALSERPSFYREVQSFI